MKIYAKNGCRKFGNIILENDKKTDCISAS